MSEAPTTAVPAPKTPPRSPDGWFIIVAENHVEKFGSGPYPFAKFPYLEKAREVGQKMADRLGISFSVREVFPVDFIPVNDAQLDLWEPPKEVKAGNYHIETVTPKEVG